MILAYPRSQIYKLAFLSSRCKTEFPYEIGHFLIHMHRQRLISRIQPQFITTHLLLVYIVRRVTLAAESQEIWAADRLEI